MREIRLYGSEGGGAARSPYPYQNKKGSFGNPLLTGFLRFPAISRANLLDGSRAH